MVKEEFSGSKESGSKGLGKVYILGSLVHNENVASLVEAWGVKKISHLDPVKKDDRVVITAHGVGREVIAEIERRGAQVFDTTCPKVRQIHCLAEDYSNRSAQVLVYGDSQHKEVQGICGWCRSKDSFRVIDRIEQLEELKQEWEKTSPQRAILVSQTTQNQTKFKEFSQAAEALAQEQGVELEVFQTICKATTSRQPEARELAQQVEAVVVIGGKDSSNTRRLWEIAQKENPRTIWIEGLNKESEQMLKDSLKEVKMVGVISGASTPQGDIEKVEDFLRKL